MNHTATWDKMKNRTPPCIFANFHNLFRHLHEGINCHLITFTNFGNYCQNIYRVQVLVSGHMVETMAFFDTGNSLYEPIRHQPVGIVTRDIANQLMTSCEWEKRLRLIPYSTVDTAYGMMQGFVADELIFTEDIVKRKYKAPVLAVSDQPVMYNNGCQVILHPDFFNKAKISKYERI